MRRILSFLLVLYWLSGCSGQSPKQAGSNAPSELKLIVEASPRQGFVPFRVTFRANLEGVPENDQEHYCLQEEWDYGDGAKSTEQPNCDTFTPETNIKTEFFAEHTYEKQGNYTVRLVLGDKKVRSRQVSVVVLERSFGSS